MILGVVDSGFKGKKEFIELSKDSNFQVVIVGVRKNGRRTFLIILYVFHGLIVKRSWQSSILLQMCM